MRTSAMEIAMEIHDTAHSAENHRGDERRDWQTALALSTCGAPCAASCIPVDDVIHGGSNKCTDP